MSFIRNQNLNIKTAHENITFDLLFYLKKTWIIQHIQQIKTATKVE